MFRWREQLICIQFLLFSGLDWISSKHLTCFHNKAYNTAVDLLLQCQVCLEDFLQDPIKCTLVGFRHHNYLAGLRKTPSFWDKGCYLKQQMFFLLVPNRKRTKCQYSVWPIHQASPSSQEGLCPFLNFLCSSPDCAPSYCILFLSHLKKTWRRHPSVDELIYGTVLRVI